MIYPKFLNKGDTIDVPSPSAGIMDELEKKRYKNGKDKLEKLGYKINLSENLWTCKTGRSESAKKRAEEMNFMFENNSNAIICACGGDFLVEILPYIDFNKIAQNPKWVMGFSDPTGILMPLTTKYDIATIYGQNFKKFGADNWHESLNQSLNFLEGKISKLKSYGYYEENSLPKITGLEGENLDTKVYWNTFENKAINVSGRILAGCLDIVMELAGTKYDGICEFAEKYKEDGIIYIFDNCELSKEELIRGMWKLNELGYFKYAKAIIFGRNGIEKNCYPEYGNMENCIKDMIISELNIPIIYDADISHKSPSMPIINGSIANISVKDGKGEIEFELC